MSAAEGVVNVDVEVEVSNPGSTAHPSPFVPCTRLGNADWVKRKNAQRQESCVEFELRPGTTLADALLLSTSAATERNAVSASEAPAAPLESILDETMGPSRVGFRVVWLSSCIFVASGLRSGDLDKDSYHRFTLIFSIETKFRRSDVVDRPYCQVFCATRMPRDSVEESVAAADLVLFWIAGRTPWHQITMRTRRNLRPCSVSTGVLKKIVSAAHPGGESREVLLDYYGLSDDEWRELFECLHPNTRLTVTGEMAESDNNCFLCLLEAIRRGYGPRRLSVWCGGYAETQMEVLGAALVERMCVVRDLIISATPSGTADAIRALLPALATPSARLQKLEVGYHSSSMTEWECIWNVAATNLALSTVRIRLTVSLLPNYLPAIETAARSNRRLMTVAITHSKGFYHETPEYMKRVLPLLQSNRVFSLTNDVKECPDASWRLRLFSASLLRLCGAKHLEVGTSRSFVAKLLRGNPDLLESCSRVSDVLRRQWDDHMRAAAFHLERVAHLELRMAQSGTEIPKKRPHPQSAD